MRSIERVTCISRFTGLPQVQASISDNTPLLNGVFWTPQVIGGSGFIISALVLTALINAFYFLIGNT